MLARTGTRLDTTGGASGLSNFPWLIIAWAALSALLAIIWLSGSMPNGDLDDLMKAYELRAVLESGNIFQRVLPGIAQPEPFATHWPWIVDVPYLALTYLLAPVAGVETALKIAMLAVPPLLLLPTLWCLRSITGSLGFDRPTPVFLLGLFAASRALMEFEPGRIDYHNLQMLMLVLSVALTLQQTRRLAFANGVVVTVAIAIGLELATFFAAVMAVYAVEFAMRRPGADAQLEAFGLGLAGAAAIMFLTTSQFINGEPAMCDRYSAPYALGLVLAGAVFAMLPRMLADRGGLASRLALIGGCGLLSLGLLAFLYPSCLQGPYADLSQYLRDDWLSQIRQEKSLFGVSDMFLSGMLPSLCILLVSVCGICVVAPSSGFANRNVNVFALLAAIALIHTVLYFRYFRFMPLFAGPGFALILWAAPPHIGKNLTGVMTRIAPNWKLIVAPGLALTAALLAHAAFAGAATQRFSGADLAAQCHIDRLPAYSWPQGSTLLAPPGLSMMALGQPGLTVVAVPYHTAIAGIERAHRFFDPATQGPRQWFDHAQATHVATCAYRGEPIPELERNYPLAYGLMAGKPPAWLVECPLGAMSSIRVYTANGTCPRSVISRADAEY